MDRGHARLVAAKPSVASQDDAVAHGGGVVEALEAAGVRRPCPEGRASLVDPHQQRPRRRARRRRPRYAEDARAQPEHQRSTRNPRGPVELVHVRAPISPCPLDALLGDVAEGEKVGAGAEAAARAPDEDTVAVRPAENLAGPVGARPADELAPPAPDGFRLSGAQVPDTQGALERRRAARAGAEREHGGGRPEGPGAGQRHRGITCAARWPDELTAAR